MYSVCARYTNNRESILEVMNLGFAKVMMNLEKYDTERTFEAWMKSIMINVSIDEFRKSRAYRENISLSNDDGMLKLDIGSSSGDWDEDITDAVKLKLDELPAVTRNVFNLHAIDGYKHKEIANMLDIPEGTSYWHYHSARSLLKEYLVKEFGIDPKKVAG
jgi:RNA polymerase sigma factor (sigma-70 family)